MRIAQTFYIQMDNRFNIFEFIHISHVKVITSTTWILEGRKGIWFFILTLTDTHCLVMYVLLHRRRSAERHVNLPEYTIPTPIRPDIALFP